jgi:hypothetical protein
MVGKLVDELDDFSLPLGMSLWWEVAYVPETFSIKPTFITDKRAWASCGHKYDCDCDTIRMEAEST